MDIEDEKKRIYERQAELCRILAHPIRLHILDNLRDGEKSVSELSEGIETTGANISTHLAVLRRTGVIAARKEGQKVFYHVVFKDVYEAFTIMREVLKKILTSENAEQQDIIDSMEDNNT